MLTSARVTDVNARSAKFERPDGATDEVEYGSLVLACSGFGGNRAMVKEHLPEIADALYFGHAGNQGDAVRWGAGLGAAAADMTAYQGHGSVATPHGILITWALMIEGGIQVNERGERFTNEHVGYSEACLPVLRQPGGVAWCVYDERLHQLGMTFRTIATHATGAVKIILPAAETWKRCGDPRPEDGILSAEISREASPIPALLRHQGDRRSLPRKAGWRSTRTHASSFAQRLCRRRRGAPGAISPARVWGYLSGNGLLSAVGLGRIAAESVRG